MSILKTMYSAASGLLAHAEAISVASDNIANVNTVGFKSQRARFEDVLGSTVAGAVDNQTSGSGCSTWWCPYGLDPGFDDR